MEANQTCPICKNEVSFSSRYPRYVCLDCTPRATDKEGRKVDFFNTSFTGHGCAGEYCDTQEPYDSNICYIDGVPCYAEEAHFGGIVVRVV
ncbi:ADP-ribosylation/Crystallin J1 [Indibacter alkaliphilus LW1]|uniref:ADP-ribosylation/Crystallin J1 n=1 Tax=Indibacter alkaliphilus (strain CCUG 57479 / KCTC 22604 / LW1) TaxID=1189612 RepID=S2DB72_INDAL|nr:hypothetical protein [Indibacter alkaliphilus]EOZ96159.1 ADP-ribosylation/Crystallin J1 [Indibacter alkaliphilus LW1]